jgi:hypothetical protein
MWLLLEATVNKYFPGESQQTREIKWKLIPLNLGAWRLLEHGSPAPRWRGAWSRLSPHFVFL